MRKCDKINRPLFCCSTAVSAGLKQTGQVVTPAAKFEMCIIHRIMNFCITATMKTGVRILHRCASYPRLYGILIRICQSINKSINQSVRPIVAELLLGKVRNEKRKTKTNKKMAMKS